MSDSYLDSIRIPLDELPSTGDGQKPRKGKSPKRLWCKFDYDRQLKLSRLARVPLIAVQAELFRLWFRLPQNDKSRPIALGNEVFAELEFRRGDKTRALKKLEKAGFVRVEWRPNQPPLVTVLTF